MRVGLADPTVAIVNLEFRAGIAADLPAAIDRLLFRVEVPTGTFGTPAADIPAPAGIGHDVMGPRILCAVPYWPPESCLR